MFRHLAHSFLLAYRHIPEHRGKWRVVDAVAGLSGLTERPLGPCVARRAGFHWLLDLGSYVDRTIFYLGYWESDVRLAVEACEAGAVAVDAGANIGWYTLHLARAVGPAGVVHAFEPVRRELEMLRANVRLNDFENVVIHAEALSDETGMVSMSPLADAGTTHIGVGGERVPCVRLDDLELPRLDFVKLDIEGAELRFLEGAAETIGAHRPAMLVELEPDNLARFGASPDDVTAWLRRFGYQIKSLGRNALARPAQKFAARRL